MIKEIDLRELSGFSSRNRAFLTLYIKDINDLKVIEERLDNLNKLIVDQDEKEIFNENIRLFYEQLKKEARPLNSSVFFICWLLDMARCYELEVPVEDKVVLGSSPFIKPVAEIRDEYEDFAVVIVDNDRARVYLVSAMKEKDQKEIRGNIKNHVKVGGWSQQRYERRRDGELQSYVKDITEYLKVLDRDHEFTRIVMTGAREITTLLRQELESSFRDKLLADEVIDLKQTDPDDEIYKLFNSLERCEEKNIWMKIKSVYLSGGLAVMGLKDVLENLNLGRVDAVLVERNFRFRGTRCRDCGWLEPSDTDTCSHCSSDNVFSADIINEITQLVYQTAADIEYADYIEELDKMGHIAALLRY